MRRVLPLQDGIGSISLGHLQCVAGAFDFSIRYSLASSKEPLLFLIEENLWISVLVCEFLVEMRPCLVIIIC